MRNPIFPKNRISLSHILLFYSRRIAMFMLKDAAKKLINTVTKTFTKTFFDSSTRIPALFVCMENVKSDPALSEGARGARKIVVTEIYSGKEKEASIVQWYPPVGGERCSVQTMDDTEVTVFTHGASQDRHYHKIGTEIYEVLEGEMVIEVAGQNYVLSSGDMIIVNPGAVHKVKPNKTEGFVSRVITVNCGGISDKYVVP
jgi:quercetin dioxygenase-like cupin family protein